MSSRPKWGGAPTEKCTKCGKTVYAAEMVKMENQIWHIECLRCVEPGCNKKLSGANWGGFVAPNNSPYCNIHLKRLVQQSGSSLETTGSTTGSKWNQAKEGEGGAPAEKKAVPADQACTKCGGRSYPAESVKMEGQLWHDNCLRCVEAGCGKKLNGSNWGGFVAPNNSPYCNIHLKRLVQSSGSSLETTGSTTGSKWNQSKEGGGSGISGGDSGAAGGDSGAGHSEGGEHHEEGEHHEGDEHHDEGSQPSSGGGSGGSGISSSGGGSGGASGGGSGGTSGSGSGISGAKPKWGGAPTDKCEKCGKTVYSAEMVKMEGKIFHDNCLRCVEEGCNKKLSGANWGGFVPPDNKPYCKVHHQRLLQQSGSSIGFSGSTTNSKWKINSTQ